MSRTVKHGLWDHPVYLKWSAIKQRCYNQNEPAYDNYGRRGITLCDEWLNNPEAFITYVMSLHGAMQPGLSIDRIRNNEGYKPGNIQWADYHIQSVNKRRRKNRSGYTGVSKNKRGEKYGSRIAIRGKIYYLGSYNSIEEAVNARNKFIIDNGFLEYKIQHYKAKNRK